MKSNETFNPVQYSIEENEYLTKYAGESPEVAELDGFPAGVNPKAVLPLLERIYKLIDIADKRGVEWAGVEAVREAAQTYVAERKKWQAAERRGGPKFPSMYVWDDRGRGAFQAVGSDSNTVKTYFDENGARQEFTIDLTGHTQGKYVPEWITHPEGPVLVPKLIIDQEKGFIQCPVCHFAKNYDPETPSTRNTAMATLEKHLRMSKKSPDAHREVYTAEFHS